MSSERFLSDLLMAERSAEVPGLIKEREQQLLATTRPITFAGAGQRATFNYIHPESTVKASAFSKGFKLDDTNSHAVFAANAIDLAKTLEDEHPDTIILKASQLALIQYMGLPGQNAAKERKRLLGGLIRGQKRGIAEMAASGVAMCMERAAVTHNMCLLAEVPSALLTGIVKTDKIDGHAFQIVRVDNQNQLFDSTNPSIEVKEGTGLLKPALASVKVAEFLAGRATVNAQIESRTDTTEKIASIEYSFQPAFPATFEGFDALGFQGRENLSNLSEQEYRQNAVIDIIQNFASTAFAVDYV
jgi:hypothetical protein